MVSRLLALLLVCLFAVAPTADALCKASCTPAPEVVSSCHETVAPAAADGSLGDARRCRGEVVLASPRNDARREASAPTLAAGPTGALTITARAGTARPHASRVVRPKATQDCPRCVVLRI